MSGEHRGAQQPERPGGPERRAQQRQPHDDAEPSPGESGLDRPGLAGAVADHPAALTAQAIVRALVGAGLTDVVIAPGSRSAPLAYALHAAEQAGWLDLAVCVDERSAAFLAVGVARRRPVAVVTTSGTAVANLHPAVLEASHSGLPVVVISADRPHELRGVGANQTTDQVGLFGRAMRWSGELPAAAAAEAARLGVVAAVRRAVTAARGLRSAHPGPVHLNVAFRDPLTPAGRWEPGPPPGADGVVAETYAEPVPTLLPRGPRTVIVAGDGAGGSVAALAQASGWPVLAEPTSGARHLPGAVAGYRVALAELGEQVERVVVLGRPTLSRPVQTLLAIGQVQTVVVGPGPDWTDPSGSAELVLGAVTVLDEATVAERHWAQRWAQVSAGIDQALTAELHTEVLTGPSVTRTVLAADTPGAATVVLGSSMTVRDADLAAGVGEGFTGARVLANRGLAGIDGTISTARGIALAGGGPVRAVIGDLTFAHDVGGLARGTHEPEVDLQVIVLNDDGGSIFATLEHGEPEHEDLYPRMFGTPQGLDLAALATGFGARHHQVRDLTELRDLLTAPIRGRSVLEIRLDPRTARQRHAALQGVLRRAARSVSS
ncbi:MAG TPA: 2-succinyl-5-enolpyruvyl-6-hydroxy-3-cyclohexene-1-carboxylic-acid synthase [Beutenbergiaceae bacterium]|nr:2-succinyl-5-enolpyruvyl-6-hydroxy-3-cyclohexene-1-carboxylic-acid synthase [Beutenbergiaceae bacterium]